MATAGAFGVGFSGDGVKLCWVGSGGDDNEEETDETDEKGTDETEETGEKGRYKVTPFVNEETQW